MKEQKHELVPDENPSNDQPGWFRAIKKKSTICELYPHCKLGDGCAGAKWELNTIFLGHCLHFS